MKKLMFIGYLLCGFTSLINAQMMDLSKGVLTKIELYHIYGKIDIQGTNDNRVVVEVLNKNRIPVVFKVVDDSGYEKSNSNLDLHIKERNSTLSIYPASKQAQFSDYLIKVPKNFKIKIINDGEEIEKRLMSEGRVQTAMDDTIIIRNISNNIEIESHSSDLICQNISGSIVVNIFVGNANISFKNFNREFPSSIETFTGNIVVSLPKETNCNVKLHTFSGSINTEFDLVDVIYKYSSNNQSLSRIERNNWINKQIVNDAKISAKINSGGSELNLGTFTGNINLFKQ